MKTTYRLISIENRDGISRRTMLVKSARTIAAASGVLIFVPRHSEAFFSGFLPSEVPTLRAYADAVIGIVKTVAAAPGEIIKGIISAVKTTKYVPGPVEGDPKNLPFHQRFSEPFVSSQPVFTNVATKVRDVLLQHPDKASIAEKATGAQPKTGIKVDLNTPELKFAQSHYLQTKKEGKPAVIYAIDERKEADKAEVEKLVKSALAVDAAAKLLADYDPRYRRPLVAAAEIGANKLSTTGVGIGFSPKTPSAKNDLFVAVTFSERLANDYLEMVFANQA